MEGYITRTYPSIFCHERYWAYTCPECSHRECLLRVSGLLFCRFCFAFARHEDVFPREKPKEPKKRKFLSEESSPEPEEEADLPQIQQ